MVKVAGEVMIDLSDENERHECLISEYVKIIGDDSINERILTTAREKGYDSYDLSKITQQNKIIDHMTAKINKCIKQ